MYQVKKITMADGKTIVPSRERIIFLKEEKVDYEIETQHYLDPATMILICKAVLTIFLVDRSGEKTRKYHGTSSVKMSPDNSNFEYESTETKAIGRACAAYGIGIEDSYASADEVMDALKKPIDTITPVDEAEKSAGIESIHADVAKGNAVTDSANKKINRRASKSSDVTTGEKTIMEPGDTITNEGGTLVLESAGKQVIFEAAPVDRTPDPDDDKPMFHNQPEPLPVEAVEEQPIAQSASLTDEQMQEKIDEVFGTKPVDTDGSSIHNPQSMKTQPVETIVVPAKEAMAPNTNFDKPPTQEVKPLVQTQGSDTGIEIPEPTPSGSRSWPVVMKISNAIEKAGVKLEVFRDAFVKLYPDFATWEESDILQNAAKEELAAAIVACGLTVK